MKSLAAEQIKVARILLNLGHSYLRSCSLENSEDEEEEEEGEEEEEEDDDDEEEEGSDEEEKEEKDHKLDGSKQKEIKTVQIESTENIQCNIKEEMDVQFNGEIKLEFNDEDMQQELNERIKDDIHSEKQNNSEENIEHKLVEKTKQVFKEETQWKFNTFIQNESYHINDNVPIEIDGKEHEVKGKLDNTFDEGVQLMFKNDIQNELNKEVQTNLYRKINYKPNKNVHIAFGENKHEFGKGEKQNTQQVFSKFYCRELCCSDLEKQSYKNIYVKLNGENQNLSEDIRQQFEKNILQELNGEKVLEEFERKKQHNCKEDNEIELEIGTQVNSEYHQELIEQMQDNLDEKQLLKEDIEIKLNIEIKVNSEFPSELDQEVQEKFDRERQNNSEGDVEIELNIEMQVDPESEQELESGRKMQQEQQISKGEEIVKQEYNEQLLEKFDREKQINIDFQNQFNEQIVNRQNQNNSNTNIDYFKENRELIDTQQTLDDKLQNEFNREKLLYIEDDIQNQSIKQNIEEIRNKSNKNVEFSKNSLEEIDVQKFDDKICVNSEFEQDLNEIVCEGFGKIQQTFYKDVQHDFDNKDIYVECNGELLKEFDKKIKVESEIEHVLKEKNLERQNIYANYAEKNGKQQQMYEHIPKFDEEMNQKCNRELLKEFDRNMDVDSEIEYELNKEVSEQQNKFKNYVKEVVEKQHQMCGNIQKFDKELKHKCNGMLVKEFHKEIQVDFDTKHKLKEKVIDNNTKHINDMNIDAIDTNIQMEYGEKNFTFFKTKSQQETEREGGIQDKIRGSNQHFKENIQLDFYENVQLHNLQQEIDEETQVKYNINKLEFEFELEALKENYKEVVEIAQKKIKEEVEKLICDLHCREHNINTNLHNSNEDIHVKLIKQIQQEIEELQTEINELNQNQDEELETEIIEKLDLIYSISVQVKFLENLLLLYQDFTPFYERVEKLCHLYFPTMCKLRQKCNDQFKFKRGIQNIFNEELLRKLDSILQKKVIKEIPCDTEVHIDFNEVPQQKINYEMQEIEHVKQLFYNNKTQHKVNEDIEQTVDGNFYPEFQGEIMEVEEKNIEVQKVIKEDTKIKCDIAEKEVLKNVDTVIKINKQIQQNMNEKIEVGKRKAQVDFNEEIMKKFREEEKKQIAHIKIKNIWQNKDDCAIQGINEYKELDSHNVIPAVEDTIQKIFEDNFIEELQQKSEVEMEVNFDRQFQSEINLQSQQYANKEIQEGINEEIKLQLEFYRKIQQEIEGGVHKNFENEVQKDFELDIETFTRELLETSDELQQELCMEMKDNFEEPLQEKYERKIQEDSEIEIQEEYEVDIEEEFEVDIEKLKDNVLKDFEGVVQKKSNTCIENSKENIKHELEKMFQQNYNKQPLQEIDELLLLEKYEVPLQEFEKEIEIYEDRNEVLEVGEEFEVESTSSIYSFISTDEELNPIEDSSEELSSIDKSLSSDESSPIEECTSSEREFSSTEEEFSSSEDVFSSSEEEFIPLKEEQINEIIQQKIDEKVKYNTNLPRFEERLNEFDVKVQQGFKQNILGEIKHEFEDNEQTFEEIQLGLECKDSQEFDDLPLNMELENIQDLDEIPLDLKIQQEQFEEELHQQFIEFQKEFYTNFKREYNEQNLNVYKTYNPKLSQVFDKQQQTFYDLKDEFHEIKQEYKGYVQQKIFEELQREINEKLLQEIKEFPEEFDVELNLVNEDIHEEFIDLQRECYELEPEFKYNVSLEFDEDEISQLFNQKPFNLFERLHYIHRQKLCEFVDSKNWPENRLYPSSLLDSLFENPLEFKPNVLVITLYSMDIGYSIKITLNKNDSPVETFFKYAEDSILQYVEKEQLPPHLLDVLDKSEPGLFYGGCVIAEIHDQINGVPEKLYRILLHPSNMSIQNDLNQILAENSHINWTYQKRLKLESMLILVSHPVMCMDSSPIAGLTVNLQHQMLSCRSIMLNPLNNKCTYSKYKSLGIDMLTDSYDDMLFTSELSNKSQQSSSSKLKDTDHIITWKFHFRIKTFKLLKLFVLVTTETQECSILLCMNSKTELFMKMRFKINLEINQLKTYISVILKILKEKINHDIIVVRKYKSNGKSAPRSIMCVPKLFNENIYEPNYADIIQLINKLLESKSKIQCDKSKYKSEKNVVLQETDGTTISSRLNKKVDYKVKKSIHFYGKRELSRNSNKNLELLNMDLSEDQIHMFESKNKSISPRTKLVSTNSVVVDSSLKSLPTPLYVLLDLDAVTLPKNNSTIPNNSPYVGPSLSSSIRVVSLEDSSVNVVQEELDSISEILSTSISTTEMLSSVSNTINERSSPIIVTSLESGPITIIPYIPSPTDVVLSVSSPVPVVTSVSNSRDIVPSLSTPITGMSSLSSPITVMSSVPSNITVVSSITSNVSPSETSSTDCFHVSNTLPRLKGHNLSISTKLKPIILSKNKVSKYSERNGDLAVNLFDNKQHQPPTFCDLMSTASGTLFTQTLDSEFIEKISVMKHTHKNGICLYGPKNIVYNRSMPQIDILKPRTLSVEQTTNNLQLDRRKNPQKFDGVSSTNIANSSYLQVTLPNVIVPLSQFLNQSNTFSQVNTDTRLHTSNDSFIKCQTLNNMKSFVAETISSTNNLINEESFQEIKSTTSSSIDDYRGVKRKRSTS